MIEAVARMKNAMESNMLKKEVKVRVGMAAGCERRLRNCSTRGCRTPCSLQHSSRDCKSSIRW